MPPHADACDLWEPNVEGEHHPNLKCSIFYFYIFSVMLKMSFNAHTDAFHKQKTSIFSCNMTTLCLEMYSTVQSFGGQ